MSLWERRSSSRRVRSIPPCDCSRTLTDVLQIQWRRHLRSRPKWASWPNACLVRLARIYELIDADGLYQAVGTTEELEERYATYEVHFTCRTREELLQAQEVMARIPGAKMADDVATRFEVPIGSGLTLSDLFSQLSAHGGDTEYAVERATLESVFLKVIRENNVQEEDRHKRPLWRRLLTLS